jgi:hypothetical protein
VGFTVGRWNVQAAGIEPKAVEMAVMQAYPISRQGTTLCQIQERVSQDREHQEKQRYAGQQKLTGQQKLLDEAADQMTSPLQYIISL